MAGHPPIKAGKIRYFKDRKFKGRVMAAPGVSDVCKVEPAGLEAVRVATREVEAAAPAAAPTPAAVVVVPHQVEPVKTTNPPALAASAPPQYDEQKSPEEAVPEGAGKLLAERANQKKPEKADDGTGGVTL